VKHVAYVPAHPVVLTVWHLGRLPICSRTVPLGTMIPLPPVPAVDTLVVTIHLHNLTLN
jgi:hypothetical protein